MRVLIASPFLKDAALDRLKRAFANRPEVEEVTEASSEISAELKLCNGVDLIVVGVGSLTVERELSFIERMRSLTDRPILAVGPATDAKFVMRTIQVALIFFWTRPNWSPGSVPRSRGSTSKTVLQRPKGD